MYINFISLSNIQLQQVQSGSDILLGSTGSFKRFESVDRTSNGGYVGCENLVYGQTAFSPPWTTSNEEIGIPPQPLRPAPMPFNSKMARHNSSSSSAGSPALLTVDSRNIVNSAPLKSVPRPVPRKQMSAPERVVSFPRILDPPSTLQKSTAQQQSSTNPFLSGLVKFESIKTNFFSSTVVVEDERKTKSAFVSKNPFNTPSSTLSMNDSSMFDFNPTAIRAILEETTDEGYLGDNDDCDDIDPLKQLEERIQKLEASEKQQQRRRSSSGGVSPMTIAQKQQQTPLSGKKFITSPSSEQIKELNLSVNEKFVDSSINDESIAGSYRRHVRNRSFSESGTTNNDLSMLKEKSVSVKNDDEEEEDGDESEKSELSTSSLIMPSLTKSSGAGGNPFLNGKRLLKTPSETYLEQYSMMRANNIVSGSLNNHNSTSLVMMNGKPTPLCKHPSLLKILQASSSSSAIINSDSSQSLTSLKRAQSSESISSDSSVVMSTLERPTPPVTGLLCVALQYDKWVYSQQPWFANKYNFPRPDVDYTIWTLRGLLEWWWKYQTVQIVYSTSRQRPTVFYLSARKSPYP